MFAFAFAGIAAAGEMNGIPRISLSGSLSAEGSTATVTGTTRTVSVPVGNSGDIRFESVITDGGGNVQYSKNGGAFTTLASNDVVNFADTDTLQMRTTLLGVGQGGSAQVRDVSNGGLITAVSINRTS